MQKSVSKICRQYSNRLTVAGIALVFLFLGISKGMAADSIESKSISLSIQNGTIQTFVSEIEKQTDYMFLYKNEDIDNSIKVNVKAENKPAIEVLNEVIAKTNLVYKINGKHIVLTRKGSADVKDIVITGKIVDNKGEAIIGANVLIKGTSSGVVSDMDGNFSIKAPNEQSVLIFSYVGYVNQEIQIGTRRTFSITLQESSLEIDELVVTALGMKRSEKALGYATQKVSGGEFEKVKGANVATSLTGRISGLTVYNSTEFLESPTLKLRGENPILVLDGVPTNMSLGEINSDDILSIDVLKGATASALYGSRGGSGAIMVTTKKGGKEGFSVTVNTSNMFNVGTLAMPEVQTAYSAGYNGKYNTDDEVWGDKLDIGRIYPQWDPIAKEMRESELTSKGRNNFKNFLEFSMISNTNVSVTQTGKNGSVRSSFSYVHNKGQYPNAKSQQFKYSIGGEMKLGDKVSVEGTLAFNKMISPNTAGTGYGNQGYIYNLLVWTGPEYDVTQYKDYWITPDEKQNWHYEGWYDNPYLMAYEKRNTIDNNTTNGMLSLNYQITPWLKALVRSGMDVSNDQTQRRAPLGINSTRNWGGTDKGYYMEKNAYAFSMNNDFILSAEKSLDKFTFEGLLGGSIYYYKTNSLEASTKNGLSIPGFYSLKASVESPNIDVYTSKKQVNSLFGKLTVGYRNAFFLDLTGRNDWSSTLPTDDNSYFYPSVGASVLLSEIMPLPDWMNFWKLRGSWTVSKNDLDIYAINTAYAVDNAVWNGMNSAYYPTTLRGSVKPITNRTYEIGTTFNLLKNNRVKADFSYYNKLTYNNTVQVNISALSGFKTLLINNDEEYERRGFEVVLDFVPVMNKDFKWNSIVNWSTSRRYYAKLDEQYSADKLWVYKGARLDAYESYDFQRDPQGNMILFNGVPKLSDYKSKIGYADPDWVWGWTNAFKYKNVVLSISIDGRVGGLSSSETNRRMWQTGAHPDTDNKWRYEEVVNNNKTFVADGVTVTSGSVTYDAYGRIVSDNRVFEKNTKVVSYETYIKDYWRKGPQLIFDETFIKLRELSLSYDIPKKLSSKLGLSSSSVSLVGQNLLLWTKEYKYADPDKASDDLSSPSVRYVGFNLKLEF